MKFVVLWILTFLIGGYVSANNTQFNELSIGNQSGLSNLTITNQTIGEFQKVRTGTTINRRRRIKHKRKPFKNSKKRRVAQLKPSNYTQELNNTVELNNEVTVTDKSQLTRFRIKNKRQHMLTNNEQITGKFNGTTKQRYRRRKKNGRKRKNFKNNNTNEITEQLNIISTTNNHILPHQLEFRGKNNKTSFEDSIACFKMPQRNVHMDVTYSRSINKNIKPFSEFEFKCKHGYRLIVNGKYKLSHKLVCYNGQWLGDYPTCELDIMSQSETTCTKKKSCEQRCVVKNGSQICLCYKGFQLINNKCIDINECHTNSSLCEYGCKNTIGSYRCKCPKGLQINSANNCVDINECILRNGHGVCQDKCVNTWGGYQCSCANLIGTQLSANNHSCEVIDECSNNNGGCSHTCINTMGRVFCVCPIGWVLDSDSKTCVDVDECAAENHLQLNEKCEYSCVNTIGSYNCIGEFEADQPIRYETFVCPQGYHQNKVSTECEDINECLTDNGNCYHQCVNTIGSFYCLCPPDHIFAEDNQTCIINKTESDIACPPLFPPKHGYIECNRPQGDRIINRPGTQCILVCPAGYQVVNNNRNICGMNGKWRGDSEGVCAKNYKTKLQCPQDIVTEIPPNKNRILLEIPQPKSNFENYENITISPNWLNQVKSHYFKEGITNVTITAKHPHLKHSLKCVFSIKVLKGAPPKVLFCPISQKYFVDKTNDQVKVTWKEPIFEDNIGLSHIFRTNIPGSYFGYGSHQVYYEARDNAGYTSKCLFKVLIISRSFLSVIALPYH